MQYSFRYRAEFAALTSVIMPSTAMSVARNMQQTHPIVTLCATDKLGPQGRLTITFGSPITVLTLSRQGTKANASTQLSAPPLSA
jgi:hypothetical protein